MAPPHIQILLKLCRCLILPPTVVEAHSAYMFLNLLQCIQLWYTVVYTTHNLLGSYKINKNYNNTPHVTTVGIIITRLFRFGNVRHL